MKIKLVTSTIFILFLTSMLITTYNVVPTVLAQEDVPFEVLDDVGTHFELQYFKVTITTDTTVHIILRASDEIVEYHIEDASEATSTQLTLGNLKPLTTYYMYEDGYLNEIVFTTDVNGSYLYTQDLTEFHQILIQPNSSTIFIDKDTTLQSDIHGSVQITADYVTLDLNGYSIIGGGGWMAGIWNWKSGVTIKNGVVRNFFTGIYLGAGSKDCTITGINLKSNGMDGIEISNSCNDMIAVNNITSNNMGITLMGYSEFNTITSNIIQNNWGGLMVFPPASLNKIYHNNFIDNVHNVYWKSPTTGNIWDDGYPSGGNYWDDYTGVDYYNGPYQNKPGSDGIGDTPYITEATGLDHYPLMRQSAYPSIQIEILVIESWNLAPGSENCLITKIESAISLLNQGNTGGAVHKLQDLIKQVTYDAKYLTQEQQAYIIQTTKNIIDLIG